MNSKKPELHKNAFYGLAGEIIRLIIPHSESDEAALYSQLLTIFGNIIGRSSFFQAEASKHYTNLFVMVVGLSSKGRKGSSLNQIKSLFDDQIFDDWKSNSICQGLSSGEGLISKIHSLYKTDMFSENCLFSDDLTVKNLLCIETEFGAVLQNMSRQGNNLSAVLRQSWDGSALEVMTRNNPLKSNPAHVSVIGHITFEELKTTLRAVDIKNGLGNRFLFFCSERSKRLPLGSSIEEEVKLYIKKQIKNSYEFAVKQKEILFSKDAQTYWIELYDELTSDKLGIENDLTGRAEAQVRRLALILSMINSETEISFDCLNAAKEIYLYCQKSVKYIFGNQFGDPILDKLIYIINESGQDGLSKTQINNAFHKNYNLTSHLDFLEQKGLIYKEEVRSVGYKPKIIYRQIDY